MVDSLKAGRAAIRDFLASYAESWTLATLNPDQKAGPVARHFTDVDAAVNWAKEQNDSGLNVYFHVNPTRAGIDKKAKKADIPAVTYLHVDIDPRAGEDIAEERERIRHRLGDGRPDDCRRRHSSSTAAVASGHSGVWRTPCRSTMMMTSVMQRPEISDWRSCWRETSARTSTASHGCPAQ